MTAKDLTRGLKKEGSVIITKRKKRIKNSADIAEIIQSILKQGCETDTYKEHFWVIGVNTQNVIQYIELTSLGTLNRTLVEPREVFGFAILKSVANIFIVHNHPSNEIEPSTADMKLTKQLRQVGDILGIKLIDHLIITLNGSDYTSFNDSGLLT